MCHLLTHGPMSELTFLDVSVFSSMKSKLKTFLDVKKGIDLNQTEKKKLRSRRVDVKRADKSS